MFDDVFSPQTEDGQLVETDGVDESPQPAAAASTSPVSGSGPQAAQTNRKSADTSGKNEVSI